MPVFNNALAGAAGSAGGADAYTIKRSLRFNDDDSAYLSRTASGGDRKTWTWSAWVKKSKNSAETPLFIAKASGGPNPHNGIWFGSDRLALNAYPYDFSLTVDRLLKDTNAWYHFVVAFDTTIASPASDRIKIWINGERQDQFTGTVTYPNQDWEGLINNNNQLHQIGQWDSGYNRFFDGYMAEVHFIDGQALDETSFGEFDSTTGAWNPIEFTGSHNVGNGVNGFYLDFSDNSSNSALGNDAVGSNNWTVNNLTATATTTNWASQLSVNNSNNSIIDPGNAFDGNLTTYARLNLETGGDRGLVWTPATTTTVSSSLRVYWKSWTSTTYNNGYVYVNGQSQGQVPSNQNGWYTVSYTGTINTLELRSQYNSGGGHHIDWVAIEIDGSIVKDPAGRDVDSVIDSPTNYDDGTNIGGNYATLNPLNYRTNLTYSQGNLQIASASYYRSGVATMGMDSGKWYFEGEIVEDSDNGYSQIGITTHPEGQTYPGANTSADVGFGWYSANGQLYYSSSVQETYSSWSPGDVVSVAYDAATRKCWIAKNGTWQNSGNPAAGTGSVYTVPGTKTPFFSIATGTNGVVVANFGQRPFYISSLPTGFKALCTQNLDDPLIAKGSTAFDVLTWEGQSGSGSRDFRGLSFKPDLAWVKTRSVGYTHVLWDSVRGPGVNKELQTDSTNQEGQANTAVSGYIDAFVDGGFDTTAGTTDNDYFNRQSTSYVGWNWNGGDLVTNSAYNQSQTWSNGTQTNPDTSRPLSNLFDNDTVTLIAAASGNNASSRVTLPASITAQTSVRYWSRAGGYNNGPTTLSLNGTTVSTIAAENGQSSGWKSFTGTFPMTFNEITFNRSSDGTGSGAAAVEVDGKVLVDKGLIPVGGLNSSLYDQSQTWSTYGTFQNHYTASGGAYLWDDVFNTSDVNNGDGSLYVNDANLDKWTLTSSQAVSNSVKIFVQGGPPKLTINAGLSDETTVTSTQTNYHYLEASFSGNVSSVSVGPANSGQAIYVMGIWFDNVRLVDDTETVPTVPTIASTVCANPSSGFSITTVSGATGSSTATIGHGLNTQPHVVIQKSLTNTYGWQIYFNLNNTYKYLTFGSGSASSTTTANMGITPTSSVVGLGSNFSGSNDYVYYCFAPVPGYSQFGEYDGNSNTEGPFVWTGFRPAFLMLKRYDTTSDWIMLDSARDPYNTAENYLYPHAAGIEQTYDVVDFLSNGFKLRYSGGLANQTGNEYIYMAFAENPFKYARAR